jgi:hypothetical protein
VWKGYNKLAEVDTKKGLLCVGIANKSLKISWYAYDFVLCKRKDRIQKGKRRKGEKEIP